MDLQEETRMKDTYTSIESIIDQIGQLSVFPSLVWVWTWDVCRDMLNNFREDPDYQVNMDNEEVWKLFWEQADTNGFTLEYGTEDLNEHISDWLIDIEAVGEYEEEEDEDE
jgi:hypothetical protein